MEFYEDFQNSHKSNSLNSMGNINLQKVNVSREEKRKPYYDRYIVFSFKKSRTGINVILYFTIDVNFKREYIKKKVLKESTCLHNGAYFSFK